MEKSGFNPRARLLHGRLPRVCVAITGATPAELVENAEEAVREDSFLEFRLDYLAKPALGISSLKDFLYRYPHVIAIATCRRAENGGRFKGSSAAQLEVLHKAAEAGCELVDLEFESAQKFKHVDFDRLREKVPVILSFHDFRGTKKLDETFEKMRSVEADFYKIVSTATNLHDNVKMIRFLERHGADHPLVGLCMGEQGIISRVLGVRAGSMFTFAAPAAGKETGPGQIAARTLRETYRIEQVDRSTRVYGVAGDPVKHSLSPAMMNTAFRRETVNAVYLALHAKSLDDLLSLVSEVPIHGLSVTMPYKEEIVERLDNSDAITQRAEACNTVVRSQDGKLYGFNTDVFGLITAIERRMPLQGAKVLVLGAGGAARAAVFPIVDKGAQVFILNRTPAAAQKLAKKARAKAIARADLKKLQFDLIVNATSLGMDDSTADSPLKEEEIKTKHLLDMVYHAPATKLVKLAQAKGVNVIPGWEMFVFQGARQFEIWTGKPAPLNDMQRAVLHAMASSAAVKKNGAS